ncbi:hypothetical protein LIER_23156 [Lithospermum erythrorhizon]|uniref:Amino acid transporter transmembrane domain-containing protein n=1 Tax=Lithospermum erythrorhizon TaxID=34254 RepID=A0AAV3QZM2_LITER
MCGFFGYAAFGDDAPGNVLTGFGFFDPFWLVDLAITFIVIHLVGAYQVLTQSVFRALELGASSKWPKSDFVMREYPVSIGWMNISFNINFLRITWRTVFVVIATLLALMMPFFNNALGLPFCFIGWCLWSNSCIAKGLREYELFHAQD